MKSGWLAIFQIAACALVSVEAGADAPAPVRIRYAQAVGCPDGSAFTQRLFSRTPHLRPAVGEEAAIEIELSLSSSGAEYRGALRFLEQNGRVTERAVSGSNCDEIVSALALIAAVLGDPATQGLSPQEGQPPAELDAASSPVEGAGRAAPWARLPAARRVVAQRAREPAPPSDDEAPTPKASGVSRWRWSAGTGALLEGAVAPDAALGAFIELGLGFEGGGGVFDPLLLLSVNRGLSEAVATSAGDAELTWTSARLGFCPLRWPPDGPMTLRACAAFDAGVLQGAGADTTDAANVAPPWWALGGFARLEARFASRIAGLLDGGLVFPLRRDRFYFDPDLPETTAFEVPAIGGFARLGVTVGVN